MNTKKTRRKLPAIDPSVYEKLCEIQCPKYEVLDFFGVTAEQMDRWCKKVYFDDDEQPMSFDQTHRRFQQRGKASLRRKQWYLADRNAAMAIHLDKKYFGDEQANDSDVKEIAVTIRKHSDAVVDVPKNKQEPDNKSADYLDAVTSIGVDGYVPESLRDITERTSSDWEEQGELFDADTDADALWSDDEAWK